MTAPTPSSGYTGPASPEVVRVLHVEDNGADAELVDGCLRKDGLEFSMRVVDEERGFRDAIRVFAPHVVLSDFSLPGFDGLAALEIAKEMIPDVPFIFVSGTIGEERAIEALKRGASDYVLKENLRRLGPAVRNALRQAEATRARETAEAMLRRSEARLKDIVNTSRDWIWECDAEGRFTFSSSSIEDMLGYGANEVLGRRAVELVDRADERQMLTTFAQLRDGEELAKPLTLRWRTKAGKVCWLERTMVAVRAANGALRGVRGIDRDVTVRVAQEVRIRRLNRALRFLSGASAAVARIHDREELLKEACRLAVAVGGYQRATIFLLPLGEAAKPLVGTFDGGTDRDPRWRTAESLPRDADNVVRAIETGELVIVEDLAGAAARGVKIADVAALLARGARSSIALPLKMDRTPIGALELFGDETRVFGEAELVLLKQVAANVAFALRYLRNLESVEYLEYFDRLTSLANRSLFLQRLGTALERATGGGVRLALLVFDICDLGMVNDALGHHAGDLLLQLVSERLKDVCRDSNALTRLAGDRFAVFHSGGSAAVGDELKERIACLFDTPFRVLDQDLRIAARAGFVVASQDATSGEELLGQAQTALDHARQANEQFLRHSPNMSVVASRRLSLINELRHAVAVQGFAVHYQPQVEICGGAVRGVEALLRWQRRDEAVQPDVFVPMLESLGLIDEVGTWVLDRAVCDTAAWAAAGPHPFRVAVNLSPLQLNREDFADRVLKSVGPAGARRLELEVTESTVMADPRRASASLALLRDAGVKIAIDDFGTGHSSLRVLAGLPVDVLKIDRSFVHDLADNRSHRLIVQGTITMAAAMGLETVAEGVETEQQAAILRDLGCSAIQGYLFHRPAPAAELGAWIAPRLALPSR